jgi:3-methyl-2-oxobutanoate hydroxymethyltransferase
LNSELEVETVAERLRKMSVEKLRAMADSGERIAMLTVYDHPSAVTAEDAGLDIAFVGDSLAMLVLGYPSTVPVTLDQMLVFMAAVSRGARTPLLLGDMPFGSFLEPGLAVTNAARIVKEGGMDAVKLEGGADVCDVVEAVVRRGMPVMGHIGLTPQTSSAHGGYRVQGRKAEQAQGLMRDAQALEDAGAFAVVLELVPSEVAAAITERLTIPTIGIGSGAGCNGQVLVWHDLLGISTAYGKHVRSYADLHGTTLDAVTSYIADVRSGRFPSEDQTWHMSEEEHRSFAAIA